MKKLALVILVLGLLGTALWWMVRRKPAAVPPGEEAQMVFQTAPAGSGVLLRYEDPQTPLRALRWLQPVPGGLSAVQVVTQSDRQQVTLFKDGAYLESYLVPKPEGIRDGFFRLAELRDVQIVPGDVAVLLYSAPGQGGQEPSLVVALDLKTTGIRWFHRALGDRLALAGSQSEAVFLYGARTPVVRLPLARSDKEQVNAAGARSAARTIELVPEVLEIRDLKATGAWTFLVAHSGGLSAHLGSKGWLHHPLPENRPGWFKELHSVLGGGPKTYWWQPFPGFLLRVAADGTPKALWSPGELTAAEPFAKDASLLHLLGTDPAGRLWFDLAVPTETAAPVPPAGTDSTDPWKPETPADTTPPVAVKLEDWPSYVSQGLDRAYRWDPEKQQLERFAWPALGAPQGFPKPGNGTPLVPGSGVLLLENGPTAWLVPLSALPLAEPSRTGKPSQPK